MPEYAVLLKDYAARDSFRLNDQFKHSQGLDHVNGSSVNKPKLFKVIKILLALSLFLIALGLLSFFLVLPQFEIKDISYSGLSALKPEDLGPFVKLQSTFIINRQKSYSFSLDKTALLNGLEQHPWVEKAELTVQFPGKITVNIIERKAIALIYVRSASGRLEAHCIDKHGVIFASAANLGIAASMPVLSGIEIRGLRYGMNIGPMFSAFLESLGEISNSDPALFSSISELRLLVSGKQPDELLLYPVAYAVPVRMKPVLNSSVLKIMLLVLDVLSKEGLATSISELDLRTDTYIYRVKEAVSG